ncbi:MAG: 16S rRNA (cytosine(1402)-N(4))-methyltransferase [Tenericutes bacterium HGW-Tenericutes-1]|jgi:16S rRNA (cytosine1402-N4)-methyltransferase|nr:MAG: 16S rRNA (cytosine(1402)-N(4))-methyltransferase [Tenericutes bacterium HGW-Tenericutes-1]
MADEYQHVSVLLKESIELLNIKPDGIYVDMTLGGGGHSEAILNHLTTGTLIGFDQDTYALSKAKERLTRFSNVIYVNQNFVHVKEALLDLGIHRVDGFIYDLGVSSFQFDIAERGFSYQLDSPLDMRMDQNAELTAYHIVNEYSFSELMQILYRYGEEPNAKMIASGIIRARLIKPIETTLELVEVIKKSLPMKILSKKGHPAKQTFQALRIAVNDELRVFETSLRQAIDLLAPHGRIAVITFHSLEDRICKQTFKELATIDIPKGLPIIVTEKPMLRLVNNHVITASEEELANNNRAKSAKLRVCEKNE